MKVLSSKQEGRGDQIEDEVKEPGTYHNKNLEMIYKQQQQSRMLDKLNKTTITGQEIKQPALGEKPVV